MRYHLLFAPYVLVALVSTSCGAPAADVPPPPVSSAAVDGLVPGQLARGAALKTEISSAGEACDEITRSFLQGTHEGFQVWNAECADGHTYGILGDAADGIKVMSCDAAERVTGAKCFEKF